MNIPKIPIGQGVEWIEDWLMTYFGPVFSFIHMIIGGMVTGIETALTFLPAIVLTIVIAALAYWIGKWRMALFAVVGLLLIDNLGLWAPSMQSLALVLTASVLAVLIGVPVGVLCAQSKTVQNIVTPVLDFMQTMPAFVYLLPAVSFFSLGVVPGVIASIIFAIPPTIRLTNLGIRQVSEELVEAADAFGSTPGQKLFKLQLPIAMPTIMAGINQTIMLSLSMVVISSMIGAQGVGAYVYRAVSQAKTGAGFEAGIAIVIIAILLDRLTQKLFKTKQQN
ncbi:MULTISPECIES: proline/glycine betaine ABC transporter permease [Paenibacillus]|uniref:Glycine betaine/proline transport system permease protein n=1 Tax=Paenibacillus typhae TaxID=1174501 RepID=A0A1G9BJ71_9BACL|nr:MULTISPECIES: proline/glycine betaine ABC transporter permease [Paenibacillus]MBY0013143.1 proline/glycine betaine ABC transporter permease [Paenibacillus typhae]MDF9842793.1 glycine betaine/proline transport system permease protein [Paenibacillus sp. PastF-2]MDF9849339.1 glycine betaine/proline transport system permease protein [Paenibacillus sp. PastM-2]MDF9855953.1 glycine betaine/proline transport system permease protein [Paenibacillus sp. PastF-1]MDH6481180.1 glycine betaine/proline tr